MLLRLPIRILFLAAAAAASLAAQATSPPLHRALTAPPFQATIVSALTALPGGVMFVGADASSRPAAWLLVPATGQVTTTLVGTASLVGRLTAVSRDGSRVAGRSASQAFWANLGTPVVVTNVGAASSGTTLRAVQAMANETVFAGTSAQKAIQVGSSGGMQVLRNAQGQVVWSDALAMSDDGATIVGMDNNVADAVCWRRTTQGTYANAIVLPFGLLDAALGVSPNGQLLVGEGGNFGQAQAMVWHAAQAFAASRLLEHASAGPAATGRMRAVTDAGSCVGQATIAGITRAIVWSPSFGEPRFRWLDDVAAAAGLALPVALRDASAIVDDGSDLHVLAQDDLGAPHYLRLPRSSMQSGPFTTYGAGTGALDTTPALGGEVLTGSGGVGDSVRFVARRLSPLPGVPIGWFGVALAPAVASPLLLDPGLLLGIVDVPLTVVPAPAASSAAWTWTVPPGGSGTTLHVQYVGLDPGLVLVFSNGLRFAIP